MQITKRSRSAGLCLAALVPLSMGLLGTQDAPGAGERRTAPDSIAEEMQGLWKLERITIPDREVPENPEVGYLLVSGSHFSLEIHGDWYLERARIKDLRVPTKTEDVISGVTQTGMHRFSIDASGTLTATSLIGTSYLADGHYEFEAPGTEREYEVDVIGDVLRFTAFGGRMLQFRRVSRGIEQRDIYGRLRAPAVAKPSEEEIEYELDVDGEIKRDIYGRPIRKKTTGDE